MTWLVWRQHRKQLAFGVAALVVLGAFFLATGLPMHDRFEKAGLPDCLPQTINSTVVVSTVTEVDDLRAPVTADEASGTDEGANGDDATEAISRCAQTARDFYDDYQNIIFIGLLLLILPMLAGMFWGAPLIAREIEHGTYRLVWTQGTSRLRWATTKIGLVLIGVLALTAVYAAMLTWWITPVIQTSGQRFDFIFFDIHGIVVFGYTTFALALGVFAGAVTGRLLPAMATSVVGFLAARLVVMLATRDHYLATETASVGVLAVPSQRSRQRGVGNEQWNQLHGDWIRSRHFEVADGCPADLPDCSEILTLHPAHHFWAFQTIETAIFVALASSLLVTTIYWIRRRIA